MDRLCDEVLQLILNELAAPAAFSQISKRHHEFTKVPYVRAMYFLARYGRMQALYYALGRGKLLNEQVIDIIMRGGAHLSRYLVQCAIHHYFRTQVPFIKSRWVRTVPFHVFSHFLSIASNLYEELPVGKGEDDGTILTLYLKQSKFPIEYRAAKWEQVRDVIEKYKFIPFSDRDPMMAQFPLVLAIEPRLLPLARQNGFNMDRRYRNFVFRRMFEKPAIMFESRADEIVQNVRELSRLDPDMFLSRTVAAEICMEAKTNEPAYTALKRLNKEGILRFQLSSVVQDLIKLFLNTRSVTNIHTSAVLRVLYKDFPSEDSFVRLVLLLTVFLSESSPVPLSLTATCATSTPLARYVERCSEEIEELSLGPLTKEDITDMLLSRFVPDRFVGILEYARSTMDLGEDQIRAVVTDVALRCLEIGCKGRMLTKLVDTYEFLDDVIATHVVKTYRVRMEDLPPVEDEKACQEYSVPLCTDFTLRQRNGLLMVVDTLPPTTTSASTAPVQPAEGDGEAASAADVVRDAARDDVDEDDGEDAESTGDVDEEELGAIGQDTLSTMIRKDELMPARRRRYHDLYTNYHDSINKLPYPAEYTQVGSWLLSHYGHLSAVAAVARLHAVINQNHAVLQHNSYPSNSVVNFNVPTTLKHFKILARLGRTPNRGLYEDVEGGCEFYFSEEDYLSPEELSGAVHPPSKKRKMPDATPDQRRRASVKYEASPTPGPSSGPASASGSGSGPASAGPSSTRRQVAGAATNRNLKRPRRSTTNAVKSYVVPDSDDEDIVMEGDDAGRVLQKLGRERRAESNLQRWIKQLAILLKEEQRKFNERKRRINAATPPGTKVKVPKTEFHKSLALHLPLLRREDRAQREKLYGTEVPDDEWLSESDNDDEYRVPGARAKRRKIEA